MLVGMESSSTRCPPVPHLQITSDPRLSSLLGCNQSSVSGQSLSDMRAASTLCTGAMTLILMPLLAASAEKELHAVIDWSSWNDTLKAHVSDGRLDYDGVAEAPGFTTTVKAVGRCGGQYP